MNIFEQASRFAIRFDSARGPNLNTEQLWGMPLTSAADGFSLDEVAKAVKRKLNSLTEDSFVTTAENPLKADLELKLEIVKHVIAFKLAEVEALKSAAANKAELNRLIEVLGDKQDSALRRLTPAQLQARIDSLKKTT